MMPLVKQLSGRAGALLPWMEDPGVTDILINGPGSLFVEREGRIEAVDSPFPDRADLTDLLERLLIPLGKRIDAAQPYADGRLADGSRFHAILPPLAVEGPVISIRKLRSPGGVPVESFADTPVAAWLTEQVLAGKNILIAGATGSGKTTLLTALLERVPPDERIVLLEETVEIRPAHPHCLHLEARPPSPDGIGEVTLRALVRNALRMRPDRIILGEVRGPEAFDLLQALNTGHRGSLATLHAKGALDALRRLESLVLLGGLGIPLGTLREWISSSVDIVVHLAKEANTRRIQEILLVHGLEGGVYRVTPVPARPVHGRRVIPAGPPCKPGGSMRD